MSHFSFFGHVVHFAENVFPWLSYPVNFYFRSGRLRERGRESQVESPMSAEPNVGLNLRALRSWPDRKPRVGQLTDWATLAPFTQLTFVHPSLPTFFFSPDKEVRSMLEQHYSWEVLVLLLMDWVGRTYRLTGAGQAPFHICFEYPWKKIWQH